MTGKTMNLTSLDSLLSVDNHRITETIRSNFISNVNTLDISKAFGKACGRELLHKRLHL